MPRTPAIAPQYTIDEANKMPRRVPLPILRPSLEQCKETAVRLERHSRVLVAKDGGERWPALVERLQQRQVTALLLDPAAPTADLAEQLDQWLQGGPIQGVYWLPAVDDIADWPELTPDAWREAHRLRVKNLALVMRRLYDVVAGQGDFLVAATQMGGLHGYGPEPALAPLGGGVTGFTKAYKRERPAVLAKAVDFAHSDEASLMAERLIAETIADPGCVEVGYWHGGRYSIALEEQPAAGDPVLELNRESVFLITGAAGGITSAIVADLAAASGGTFYLLDLTPEPDPADPRLALFGKDKEQLRGQLIAEARAAGEKPTPVAIEKALAAVERAEAALRAIEAVQEAGGTAVYHSVNLLDYQAVGAVVADIEASFGRIDVLVHGAGIEISKRLDQKPLEQFALVYDIKADGFYNLLHAAREMPVGATVVFSSVAGRFGNAGQTDYSAANDLLCKMTSHMRRFRPETQAIAIDWTAWSGIGMATRGSIPKIMEMAGIEMLPMAAGIPTTRRELSCGFRGELLVGGKLGLLVDEFDETGGLGISSPMKSEQNTLLIGSPAAATIYSGWQVEKTLDPQIQPFLNDHVLEGTPLLPGVMGTEAFAELAQLMVPEMKVDAVQDVQFLAPFKFYRFEPQTLYLRGSAVPDDEGLMVKTGLYSRRELVMGVQEKLHFTAVVRMRATGPSAEWSTFSPPESLPVKPAAIYDIYFHGPAYQVLAGVEVKGRQAIGRLACGLPPNINPAGMNELAAPRLVELCFQTAGVWQISNQGKLALPQAYDELQVYRQERDQEGDLYAIVEAANDGAPFNARVVDDAGRLYLRLTGYRTVTLPGEVQL